MRAHPDGRTSAWRFPSNRSGTDAEKAGAMRSLLERYGIGVHTLPFGVRVAVTVPAVLVTSFFVTEIVLHAKSGDSRPAALFMVILVYWLFMTVPMVHGLWRPTHESLQTDRHDERRADMVAQQVAWTPPRRDFPIATYDGTHTAAASEDADAADYETGCYRAPFTASEAQANYAPAPTMAARDAAVTGTANSPTPWRYR